MEGATFYLVKTSGPYQQVVLFSEKAKLSFISKTRILSTCNNIKLLHVQEEIGGVHSLCYLNSWRRIGSNCICHIGFTFTFTIDFGTDF